MSKRHAADVRARDEIAAATAFSVFMLVGGERIVHRPIASLVEAVRIAEALEAQHPRKAALIYALVDQPVPHDQPIPRDLRAAASAQLHREDQP